MKIVVALCLFISLVGCSKKNEIDIASVTELPIVYIDTINNSPIDKLEKVDKEAEFKIVYTDGTTLEVNQDDEGNFPMTIKGRGNSSWTMPTGKKPYNIKFTEKQDLFGFGEAKKWSLIASWTDTSFVRNYIAYQLGKTLDEATPDAQMVELVINGNYEGIYLLCEAYGINKHRVETKGDGSDINGDGEITEFLIEADSRALTNNEPLKFLTPSNYWMVMIEPDEDEILSPTDNRFVYMSDYMQKVDQAIVNLDHYEDYIDVDSLVDMYLINEVLKNPDWGFGNQPCYASTFMYMEEGGKLCFGPLWDCDISMGRNDYVDVEEEGNRNTYDPEGYLAKDTHWINQLMNDSTFVSKVKARWQEFKPEIEKMINETAPAMIKKVGLTQALDYQTWDEEYSMRTTQWSHRTPLDFEEESAWVLEFMQKRLNWMDQEFGK